MKVSTLCVVALALVVAVSAVVLPETRTVMYNRKNVPSQWQFVGFPDASQPFRFTVGLKQRNLAQLESKFWAIATPGNPEYRNFMTRDQVWDLIAPPQNDHDYVVSYLKNHGVSKVVSRRDSLLCYTTVAVAQQFFNTKLYTFKSEVRGHEIVRQMGEWSVPTALMPYVDIVTGVSDFPMLKKPIRAPLVDAAVVPDTLATIYNVPAGTTANNASQGVIEFGSGQYFNPNSLQSFAKGVGLEIPALDPKHIISPEPPVGVEGTLDIQYIAGMATGADNWYWTETDWLYDWSTSFFAAADVPDIVSVSYGWAEYDQCDITDECSVLGVDAQQYVLKVNTEFQKIGVRGTSIIVASGDSGANGRTDPDCTDKILHPDYPACSPYVTSVGATQLNSPDTSLPNPPPVCKSGQWQCASGGDETAVSFQISSFASGGGFSNFAAQPDYQSEVVKAYFASGVALPPSSYYNVSGRGYPDVSALGHNFLCYDTSEGGWYEVGGTSASSPTFAGFMTFLNNIVIEKTQKPLGFLNPFLYQMAAAAPSAFRDITVGDNICTEDGCSIGCKGFRCAQGWDPVTGLGVPDVSEMIQYVQSQF